LRKSNEDAYVIYDDDNLEGFMYLKEETGYNSEEITLVNEQLPKKNRLKIGTLKTTNQIQGRRFGEGLIGLALWKWADTKVEEIYITTFPKQKELISMLLAYGFVNVGEIKDGKGELVFIKNKKQLVYSNPKMSFPYISETANGKIFIVEEQFHDTLFPYSELKNTEFTIQDYDVKNGMSKFFISNSFKLRDDCKVNDFGIIYRKSLGANPSYKSCATGICTVEQVIPIKTYIPSEKRVIEHYSFDEFVSLLGNKTVLTQEQLKKMHNKDTVVAIQIMYNYSFGAGNNVNYRTLVDNNLWEKEGYPYNKNYTKNDLRKLISLRNDKNVRNVIVD
jgi:hypothetical protein